VAVGAPAVAPLAVALSPLPPQAATNSDNKATVTKRFCMMTLPARHRSTHRHPIVEALGLPVGCQIDVICDFFAVRAAAE
jgi:uncharacterized RDD family membrane protein YckC